MGVRFYYDEDGLTVDGGVTLTSQVPHVSFDLTIHDGTIAQAGIAVDGGFGFRVSFKGDINGGENINREFPIPADFTIPLGEVFGIPLAVNVSQALRVQTVFGAKKGSFNGSGEFTLAGSIGFHGVKGSYQVDLAKNVGGTASLTNSLSGVSPGVMGILLGHTVRFTVGIGAGLFTAGVFIEVKSQVGASRGSTLGAPLAICRGVGLGFFATYGVGYKILQPVTDAINKVLSLLSSAKVAHIPPISSTGGIPVGTAEIWTDQVTVPNVNLCKQ
jgi:hypothetical protein